MPATHKPERIGSAHSAQQVGQAYNTLVDYLSGNQGLHLPNLEVVGDLTAGGDVHAGGNLIWKSGTNFTMTLDHAATANRVITVPDATDTLALLGRSQTFTGTNTFNLPIVSAVTSGSALAPLTVASNIKVVNLHADLLDGAHATVTPTANAIPIADAAHLLDVGWLPITSLSGLFLPLTGGTMAGPITFSPTNTVDVGSPTLQPRNVHVGSKLGVGFGVTPVYPLHLSASYPADWVARLAQTSAVAGSKGIYVQTAGTSAADAALLVESGTVTRFAVNNDGAITGKGNEPLAKAPIVGRLGSNYNLTTSYGPLSGCSATLTPGYWVVVGTFDFLHAGAADIGATFLGRLVSSGGGAVVDDTGAVATLAAVTSGQRATVTQTWRVAVTSTTAVHLEAEKTSGTGSSQAISTVTALVAWYGGNP